MSERVLTPEEVKPPCERCGDPAIIKVRAFGLVSDFCLPCSEELIEKHEGKIID